MYPKNDQGIPALLPSTGGEGVKARAITKTAAPAAAALLVLAIAGSIPARVGAVALDGLLSDGFESVPLGCAQTIQTPTGPRSRVQSADVIYGIAGYLARPAVQLAEYDSVWGYNNPFPSSVVTPWPGVGGSSPFFSMSRTGYFGAHFHTTVDPTPPGYFVYGNYGGTIPVSMSISPMCGDFAGDPATDGCYVENHPSDDSSFLRWQFGEGVSPYRCYLLPDTDYYLNVMFTDTHPTDPDLSRKCPNGATCTVLIKSMGH
jgi:hypothetical protein